MSADQATTAHPRPDGSDQVVPHPLEQLSIPESDTARQIILDVRGSHVAINFRSIALEEPLKKELVRFLQLEHAGKITPQTPRPARIAKVQYDVVRADRNHEYMESLVNVEDRKEVQQRIVDKMHQSALTT
jgi:primary-amine oxidase